MKYLSLLRKPDFGNVLWQNILKENFVDELSGAGLELVILQLLLPGVVQQVDVLILAVKKQEVEEETDQEGKVREISLVRVCCPYLVAKTLALRRRTV